MYKVKHYVNNLALRYIASQFNQLTSIVWDYCLGKNIFMSCTGTQYVVLNRAMRCLNTNKLLTNKVTTIYKIQKNPQLKDIYNLEVSKFMYKYTSVT